MRLLLRRAVAPRAFDCFAQVIVAGLQTDGFPRSRQFPIGSDGFHRIRHYGLFASHQRADNIARARELLNAPAPPTQARDPDAAETDEPPTLAHPCPCCGGLMIIIETFRRGATPRYQPTPPTASIRIDTS
jgi:hypothetical protein